MCITHKILLHHQFFLLLHPLLFLLLHPLLLLLLHPVVCLRVHPLCHVRVHVRVHRSVCRSVDVRVLLPKNVVFTADVPDVQRSLENTD